MSAALTDLWTALGGAPAPVGTPGGRLLLTIRSGCGSRLAQVHQERDHALVVLRPYRLTRAHTNMVVFDQAMLDLEELIVQAGDAGHPAPREDDPELILRLTKLLEQQSARLPVLTVPESRVNARKVAECVEQERVQSQGSGHLPREVVGLATSCPKCKSVLYLGNDIAGWWAQGGVQREIIAQEPLRFSRAGGWTFDRAGLADRLTTYRRLEALLELA